MAVQQSKPNEGEGNKANVAPAPGRVRDDASDPATYGFRNLSDAPEVKDSGPGALEPQRVDGGVYGDDNSTFGSRAAANKKRVSGSAAENKSVSAK